MTNDTPDESHPTSDTFNRRNVLKKVGVAGTIGVGGLSQTASAQTECSVSIIIDGTEFGGYRGLPLQCAEEDGCPGLAMRIHTNISDLGVERVQVWGDSCDGRVMTIPDHTREQGECPQAFWVVPSEGGDNVCWEVGGELNILIRYCENCRPSLFRTEVPDFDEQIRLEG